MSKRDSLIELLKAGTCNREQLIEQTGLTSKSLGTNFTYLRMLGFFPVKKEGGIYHLVSKEEYAGICEARKNKAPKSTLSKEERMATGTKRVEKAEAAVSKAEAAVGKKESVENKLRLQVAKAELELAQHLLAKVENENA